MGWISDDANHEGYLLPHFLDGQRGVGVTGGGIPPDRIAVGEGTNRQHRRPRLPDASRGRGGRLGGVLRLLRRPSDDDLDGADLHSGALGEPGVDPRAPDPRD